MSTEPEIRLDERRRLADEITLTIQFLESQRRGLPANTPGEILLAGNINALRNLQSRLRNKRKNRA